MFSEDEKAVLFVGALIALIGWGVWYGSLGYLVRRPAPEFGRRLLRWMPLICLGCFYGVLRRYASEDVRYAPAYIAFYLVIGAAWLVSVKAFLPLLGLSVRDDVIERGNRAAGIAIAGGLLGLTFCFAGGNIGNGPGWWVVLFSGSLSTAAWLLLWGVTARAVGWADRITIDRDEAAAWRAFGFLTGLGLMLGRGVAGDWISASATVREFVLVAWPAVLVAWVGGPLRARRWDWSTRRRTAMIARS